MLIDASPHLPQCGIGEHGELSLMSSLLFMQVLSIPRYVDRMPLKHAIAAFKTCMQMRAV